jgi:hypothetical protein
MKIKRHHFIIGGGDDDANLESSVLSTMLPLLAVTVKHFCDAKLMKKKQKKISYCFELSF